MVGQALPTGKRQAKVCHLWDTLVRHARAGGHPGASTPSSCLLLLDSRIRGHDVSSLLSVLFSGAAVRDLQLPRAGIERRRCIRAEQAGFDTSGEVMLQRRTIFSNLG